MRAGAALGQADTIFASATGANASAIGIMRVSGPKAFDMFGALLEGLRPPERRFGLMRLIDPDDGLVVDEVGVLWFQGPASYTGEHLVEVHHHGSPAIRRWLHAALARLPGLRVAEAGELTRQALRNGKLDLVGAEAVADIVAARSSVQVKMAAKAMSGDVQRRLASWSERMLDALARVEAEIDFGLEDDVASQPNAYLATVLTGLVEEISEVANRSRDMQELGKGIIAGIFGPPNAGKSSLINALAGREVAIVTPEPGTTRDAIEVSIEYRGQLLTFVDTAGLRVGESAAEIIGIERTRAWLERCDVRLWVLDCPHSVPAEMAEPCVKIWSKADLRPDRAGSIGKDWLETSTVTGEGLTELLDAVHAHGCQSELVNRDEPSLNERQLRVLDEACGHLSDALVDRNKTIDLVAEDLRCAVRALGRILGQVDDEDVLSAIFSRFCIGK